MSTNTYETPLHSSPFCVLGVTTRDDRRKIVEMAEERSLQLDSDICQKARSDLTNPKARLAAEMAWMPGVAPKIAENVVRTLSANSRVARSAQGLPALARANVMAAACELVADSEPVSSVAGFIQDFAEIVESIDPEDVLRDVNEDRGVSGFPQVQGTEVIEEVLSERRKSYRTALKDLLDTMEPARLIETMAQVVRQATDDGKKHAPILLDDLVDSYEVETQGFLQKEAENISTLIGQAREAAPRGDQTVDPILDRLEKVARNWHRVALPILISAKSRGTTNRQSRDTAYELRGLSLALNNDHGMIDLADRLNRLLRELFAELPDVAEKLGEDAHALQGLRSQADERARNNEKWEREITFRAEVGLVFKEELAISPQGVRWRGQTVPLDSITRVRWGGVRRSINGVPTGTDYTIAFGDNRSQQSIGLRKEAIYTGFTGALWRAVCIRLLFEMVAALEKGQSFSFGDITIQDDAVTLTRHRTFAANEQVRLGWNDVRVWTHDGNFVIGKKDDKKVYGSASYINGWNTHVLEHLVRGGFKKGIRKLSDYLKD
ncbi:conserved hypothetical protein [Paraburkholderia atlantica]|uniref:Uncharacterized protein n=1 Tax=Paraburkholderia atlantica TaxID=2654982 RepID=D5WA15_PARAM|nr:hypothetical protein [Paraburkholderia atlantica]ADG14237.1 conserved hypothetical protein [Paraburkholderia atlantica]